MAAVNKIPLFTVEDGVGTTACVAATITVAGEAILDDADAAAQRTTLGLGTLATQSGTFSGTSSGTNTGDQTISDATISTTDITTNNATTLKHGFLQKLDGLTTTFLRGDGTWAAPTAAAADPSYSPGSFTVSTETQRFAPYRLQMTTTQRITIEGTGRLSCLN